MDQPDSSLSSQTWLLAPSSCRRSNGDICYELLSANAPTSQTPLQEDTCAIMCVKDIDTMPPSIGVPHPSQFPSSLVFEEPQGTPYPFFNAPTKDIYGPWKRSCCYHMVGSEGGDTSFWNLS